jgi:hypothetical protein
MVDFFAVFFFRKILKRIKEDVFTSKIILIFCKNILYFVPLGYVIIIKITHRFCYFKNQYWSIKSFNKPWIQRWSFPQITGFPFFLNKIFGDKMWQT